MPTPRKQPDPSKKPRRPRKPRVTLAPVSLPDPPPLPYPPFAKCPRCGQYVRVIVCLDNELWPHRTPLPQAVMCEGPTRVKRAEITFGGPEPAGLAQPGR